MKGNEKGKGGSSYASRRKKTLSIIALVIAVIFLVWTLVSSLMVVAWADTGKNVSADEEMRGIWVSTVMNLDYPTTSAGKAGDAAALKSEADTIIKNCKEMGMNAIFLQVRPCGDALYKSEIFPWSKYTSGTQGKAPSDNFDPLEYWVSEAHKQGIELHAWINPYRITHSSMKEWEMLSEDNPAKKKYADCVIKHSDGYYYYDPGNPDSMKLIVDGACEIVKNYDVDGIHMDDYFYPGKNFADDASFTKYGSGFDNRDDWRRNNVNTLVAMLDTELHKLDPDIRFGISPQGIWANSTTIPNGSATAGSEAYNSKFADSLAWIASGTVDYIAPQIYWNVGYSIADYSVLAKWWSRAVSGSDVDLYIGMADYRSANVTDTTSVWYGTDELKRQLEINKKDKNISGEIHFRYKLMADDSRIVDLYKDYYKDAAGGESTGSNDNPENPGQTDTPVTPENPGQTDAPSAPSNPPDDNNSSEKLFDIKGHWAELYIRSLESKGIISGMSDGSFMPENNVTRAQFVKMIVGAIEKNFGEIDYSEVENAGFTDVPSYEWYVKYVNWAAGAGIVSGMEDGTFRPNDNITREQMAVIIKNVAAACECDFGSSYPMINFEDKKAISSWASSAVEDAVRAGIINGTTVYDEKGNPHAFFNPQGLATRAQAAKVIYVINEKLSEIDPNL